MISKVFKRIINFRLYTNRSVVGEDYPNINALPGWMDALPQSGWMHYRKGRGGYTTTEILCPGYMCITTKVDGCTTVKILCPGYMCITTKVDGCTTVKVEGYTTTEQERRVDILPQRERGRPPKNSPKSPTISSSSLMATTPTTLSLETEAAEPTNIMGSELSLPILRGDSATSVSNDKVVGVVAINDDDENVANEILNKTKEAGEKS
ncbi:2058_t:CDS:2 [Ambispora gerdemannii]|uniref:2058_t:CDS:1 n=1 Tax=Ambispora gerdemannii TaxID=144530 RepID=A0A9N9G9A4_9GLOM|nr:2058_t:CDS:2 [Ambispora gerdemannii]